MEWPIKALMSVADRLRDSGSRSSKNDRDSSTGKLESDLLNAATFLYQQATSDNLQHKDNLVATPAAVGPAREALCRKDWKAALTHIQAQRATILSWSSQLENDLKELADQLRRRMGIWDRMRQTFAALLNVLPATAAITYVLSTGDPVGATGIKIKLTGLLGLKDLYALIAIPATAGLKKADQKQLALLLEPVARTWLEHKFTQVQALFEQHITGQLLDDARSTRSRAGELLSQAERIFNDSKEMSA
jgi:hypothetical protein